jgi:hypothetical protein
VLILWLAVSAFGVSLFINISALVGGPKRTTCTWDDVPVGVSMDNAHENGGQGVVCIMQAIGIYYFGLACNFWWFASTLHSPPPPSFCLSPSNWRRSSHDQHLPHAVLPQVRLGASLEPPDPLQVRERAREKKERNAQFMCGLGAAFTCSAGACRWPA